MKMFRAYLIGTALGLSLAGGALAQEDTIKIGVLHSLSGTMAISETDAEGHRPDARRSAERQGRPSGQEARGGGGGPRLRLAALRREGARAADRERCRRDLRLLDLGQPQVGAAGDRGVERPPVLPGAVEGEESSKNVLYTGCRAEPAGDSGGGLFPRGTGRREIRPSSAPTMSIRARRTTSSKATCSRRASRNPTSSRTTRPSAIPTGRRSWRTSGARRDGKKVGVISTINGDANIGFYKELAAAGISAEDIPVVAFSVGEEELSGLDTSNLVGHLAAWNYFQSAESPENEAFIKEWKARMGEKRVTNDPMEATYIGFNMWVNAVTAAGTTDVDPVAKEMIGQKFPNLTGSEAEMLPNHHLTKPVLIGEIRDDGQFDIISQTDPVPGDAWTDFLPESAVLESDWAKLDCGMYNTETKSCVQIKSNY
uniref:AmiR n=1 Tax=Cereibacter sphaeroides TaxID=1063 RepID=Q9RFE8_CERSP|nr:AmiR [Cereibacter sphaeroides]